MVESFFLIVDSSYPNSPGSGQGRETRAFCRYCKPTVAKPYGIYNDNELSFAKCQGDRLHLKCKRRAQAGGYYGFLPNASRHSAGTHFSAITQKSRHGGRPV